MRTALLVLLCALSVVSIPACQSLPQIVIDQGPSVLRTSTSIGVQWALAKSAATAEEAQRVKTYLIDGKNLLNTGVPPVTALDELAALLNARITSPTVRAIIQSGIETLKTKVTIPVDGKIPQNVKLWVNAVLDGAIAGCDSYIPGSAPLGAAPEVGGDWIKFR